MTGSSHSNTRPSVQVGVEVPSNDCGYLGVGLEVQYVVEGVVVICVVINVDGSEGAGPEVDIQGEGVVV
jgi:hypothetical protein